MQFNETAPMVLDKSKTQTSRLFKDGDCGYRDLNIWEDYRLVENINGRRRFEVGQVCAVQVGRRGKTIGTIQIKGIHLYDVRTASDQFARAEGFASFGDFIAVWCKLNDRTAARDIRQIGWQKAVDEIAVLEYLH